jgi:hypothetical protein
MSGGTSGVVSNGVSSGAPFRRRTIWWLAGIAATSFVAAIVVAIFGQEIVPTTTAGAHGYSRSAIGHHGLVALLRALDVQVLQSEHDSAGKASEGVLVVAEPLISELDGPRAEALRDMHVGPRATLVVLPKWYGLPDYEKDRAWVSDIELLPVEEVQPVLQVLGIETTLVRPERTSRWIGSERLALSADPALPAGIGPQLLVSDEIEPLISCDAGILLGLYRPEEDDPVLLVLSDPDVLSNHGLRRGRNAELAVGIIELLRRAGATSFAELLGEPGGVPDGVALPEGVTLPDTVVFDETLHGFQKEPSLWRALFEFPLALATIQVLLAAVALLWASLGRFGKPITAAPALTPGKGFLIHNTATLLRHGGHGAYALARYLEATARAVAHALHVPPSLDAAGLRRWLAQVESARNVTHSLTELARQVEAARNERPGQSRAVRTAMHIHQWREEMIRGSRDRSRD